MSENLTADVKKIVEKTERALSATEKACAKFDEATREIDRLKVQMTEIRNHVRHEGVASAPGAGATMVMRAFHGGSGADDLLTQIGRTFKALILTRTQGATPKEFAAEMQRLQDAQLETRAPAVYDTATSATAGYAVPQAWATSIDALRIFNSGLQGRVRTVPCFPGQTLHIPREGVRPLAYCQKTQGTAITETEGTFTEMLLRPVSYGTYYRATDELLTWNDSLFGAYMLERLTSGIAELLNKHLLIGASAADAPHNGVLIEAGTTSIAALASMTEPNLATALGLAWAAYPATIDPRQNVIIMEPAKWAALLAALPTANNTLITPASALTPTPTFAGYDVLLDPNCATSGPTVHLTTVFDPSDIWLATDRAYRILADPYTLMTQQVTRVRMILHADFGLPTPAKFIKAVITA